MLGSADVRWDAGTAAPNRSGGVKQMRPTTVWSTIKQFQLEKDLIWVPRTQKVNLRAYIAGRKFTK